MATIWYITKEFLLDNNSNISKLAADKTGVGEGLYKVYKDAAYEYDSASKLYAESNIDEEQLQEKENTFVLEQTAWAEWVSNN
jgi:hypothetical protein